MKKLLPATLLLLSFATAAFCQSNKFLTVIHSGSKLFVCVRAGLSIREAPALTAKVLTVVKMGEAVIVAPDGAVPLPVTNSGIAGIWVKVKYKDVTGFQFSGFLSRFPPMNDYADVRSYGEFQEYLKSQFKLLKYDTASGEYHETLTFENKIVYERSGEEHAFVKVAFPASIITYQEVYLMVRSAYPELFYARDAKCGYKQGDMSCETFDGPMTIKEEDGVILHTKGLEGM